MTDLDEVRSVRTEGDSWAITENVGATALGVAASRAVETASPDPLIRDEFAYLLVSSAGSAWARLASPDMGWIGDDEHGRRAHRVGCDYQAVRTHFFDEYFNVATQTGLHQVVILAAGLDSRAYRLDWPANTTVYEIDRARWARMRRIGLDVNVETLTYRDRNRADAAQSLIDHGWQVNAVNNRDEMARLGRPIPEDLVDEMVTSTLIRARFVAAS